MPETRAAVVLLAVALWGNVPLGWRRCRARRWSIPRFIRCDGSVLVRWLLRHYLHVDSRVIIPEILLALAGNISGPRLVRCWQGRSAASGIRHAAAG